MAWIDTSDRQAEMIAAQTKGELSAAVAATLEGLLSLAACGQLATFTNDGLKPLSDYEREQCAIAQAAISQHWKITFLPSED